MISFLKYIAAAIVCVSTGSALAGLPAQQYQATFVHRYADSSGMTIWDEVGLAHVSDGQDGSDVKFPSEAAFFVSLSANGSAHVFFHGKDMRGSQWLSASRTFSLEPAHREEIVLQDQSMLYVTVKPIP